MNNLNVQPRVRGNCVILNSLVKEARDSNKALTIELDDFNRKAFNEFFGEVFEKQEALTEKIRAEMIAENEVGFYSDTTNNLFCYGSSMDSECSLTRVAMAIRNRPDYSVDDKGLHHLRGTSLFNNVVYPFTVDRVLSIYGDWLIDKLTRGAFDLLDNGVKAFSLTKLKPSDRSNNIYLLRLYRPDKYPGYSDIVLDSNYDGNLSLASNLAPDESKLVKEFSTKYESFLYNAVDKNGETVVPLSNDIDNAIALNLRVLLNHDYYWLNDEVVFLRKKGLPEFLVNMFRYVSCGVGLEDGKLYLWNSKKKTLSLVVNDIVNGPETDKIILEPIQLPLLV